MNMRFNEDEEVVKSVKAAHISNSMSDGQIITPLFSLGNNIFNPAD